MNAGMKPGSNRMQIPNILQQQGQQQGHQGMGGNQMNVQQQQWFKQQMMLQQRQQLQQQQQQQGGTLLLHHIHSKGREGNCLHSLEELALTRMLFQLNNNTICKGMKPVPPQTPSPQGMMGPPTHNAIQQQLMQQQQAVRSPPPIRSPQPTPSPRAVPSASPRGAPTAAFSFTSCHA
ncbi:GATA zinc finger domain-containing protein 10-like [Ctenocephalides felis]|uniref:GATA zinc finger domain-containing protein 10-like n=1 Tax=Ctenocephalides felis TaxID=7515 RepID=UPI000E6E2EF8|nr:GATA zinc finger domain-containing protein 10-like [Ctenocephalides felis]